MAKSNSGKAFSIAVSLVKFRQCFHFEVTMSRLATFAITATLAAASSYAADPAPVKGFVETNVKIITLRDSGFGPEGKAEKFAGIKLDTKAPLAAGCAWDVIAFDPSTETGKKTLQELTALAASKAPLKSISFTKDAEGDCYLEKYEK
jgi:hypothetical protein